MSEQPKTIRPTWAQTTVQGVISGLIVIGAYLIAHALGWA